MAIPVTAQAQTLAWWNGNDYHNHSTGQQGLANHLLSLYTFKPNERVLDIGCGDGAVTQQIGASKIPQGIIIGLDSSHSMIECAHAQNKYTNVSFIQGLAESFHFNDPFDTIVSFSALHWASDQQAIWNNIRSHLKVGGRVLISLNPLPRSPQLTKAIDEVTHSPEYAKYFERFVEKVLMPEMSIEQYRKIILDSGLQIIECQQSTKYFEYENPIAFALSLKAWLPQVSQLPEDKKVNFVKEIAAKFSEQPKLDYNNFFIHAVRNN